jgi:hypothetical protein
MDELGLFIVNTQIIVVGVKIPSPVEFKIGFILRLSDYSSKRPDYSSKLGFGLLDGQIRVTELVR